MGLHTYNDPPTVAEVEKRRLQARNRLMLLVLLLIVLLLRYSRGDQGSR
jgi:hypothetical protein